MWGSSGGASRDEGPASGALSPPHFLPHSMSVQSVASGLLVLFIVYTWLASIYLFLCQLAGHKTVH